MTTMTSPFLLLTECAEHARVAVSTIRYWITTGKLRSVRPGRRRMVRRDDLDAFLAGLSGETISPPAPKTPQPGQRG
jgi:excisionase family DNA binding protein